MILACGTLLLFSVCYTTTTTTTTTLFPSQPIYLFLAAADCVRLSRAEQTNSERIVEAGFTYSAAYCGMYTFLARGAVTILFFHFLTGRLPRATFLHRSHCKHKRIVILCLQIVEQNVSCKTRQDVVLMYLTNHIYWMPNVLFTLY